MDTIQPVFRALADPTRRAILSRLATQDMTITNIAAECDVTRTAVRKHITILEEGALVSIRPEGRERLVRLEPQRLRLVVDWVGAFDRFWNTKLTALQSTIAEKDLPK